MSCEFEDETFTVEDVINRAGFGKFQIRLLFLSGLGSIADACEVFILSIIGQFLACEWPLYREQIAILTYTVFIGIAIGNVVLGTLADTYGRKKVLVITAVSLFVFGFSNAFVPSFVWMVVCRSIIGFALGGASQGFTIYAEYCPANMRGKAGFYLCYFWSIGTMIVILLSWAVMLNLGSWRLLLALLSLPGLVVMVSLKWYPESARYYLVSGQYEKAVKILRKLANLNGTGLPPGRLEEVTPSKERGRLKDLLSKDYRRSTLLLWFIWLAVTLTAYGTVFISPIIIQQGFLGKIEHTTKHTRMLRIAVYIQCLASNSLKTISCNFLL
ncbi:synaptic vesicle 2-related protein [Caerostris extrusa]|uniref:Synaptic vesicle 2-related protein n=1 Tax=Caerostris extrusa TaxID=172846 RepID=A0AAV4SI29_CAEEX|nr:synaptic vesicle 2-related protein [Caerostris extrusa]